MNDILENIYTLHSIYIWCVCVGVYIMYTSYIYFIKAFSCFERYIHLSTDIALSLYIDRDSYRDEDVFKNIRMPL